MQTTQNMKRKLTREAGAKINLFPRLKVRFLKLLFASYYHHKKKQRRINLKPKYNPASVKTVELYVLHFTLPANW